MTIRVAPLYVLLLVLGQTSICSLAEASGSIYKCEAGGVTTYSDRPCSRQAQLHELDLDAMNTYEAPAGTTATRTPTSQPKRAVRRPAERNVTKHQELCARTARTLKEIAGKMRSGYSAKEGERLRERQVKLRDQQRAARCR